MHLYNFLVCGPKFTRFLLSNVGGAVVDQLHFRFLMCRHWDIRDQSRKLSEIAPKFGRFSSLPHFGGRVFRKLYVRYQPCLTTRRLEKFYEDIPTSSEIIGVHTLNFRPNFKFSRLEFFRGTSVPLRVCAMKAWSISSACKIFGALHPLWAEI